MASPSFGVPPIFNQNRFLSQPSQVMTIDTGKSPTGSTYLPGFLLGNVNYSTSPSFGRSLSTANCHTSPVFGRSLSTTGYQNQFPSKINSKSPPARQSGHPYASAAERKKKRMSLNNSSNQDGAPPTESLYSSNDIVSSNVAELNPLKNDALDSKSKSISKSFLNGSMAGSSPEPILQSPAQIDPFYTQGDAISSNDVLDEKAVTVFGFPPAASSFILQQFAQYGTIEKHEIHNAGNWLHLRYENKIQAKKALSKNGKIFARTIMIGVTPCIKKEISNMEKELDNSLPGTPNIFSKRPSSMRPLARTSSPMNTPNFASGSTPNKGTPKKNDSLVGKALDYVFGW